MVNGITLHLKTEELKELLGEQIKKHKEKAALYKEKVASLEAIGVDALGNYSNNPIETVEKSMNKHLGKAEYYQFLVDHLVPNETYEMSESDLTHLGIITYYY